MTEMLYGVGIILIAAILLVMVSLAIYGGYQLGLKRQLLYSDPMKSQVVSIQGSLLGLLSLLLGFTFSIALQHFDKRSEAMKEEANAIGTTYLRAHSLPDTVRNETLATLKKYVDVRVQVGEVAVANMLYREPLLQEASELRVKLWDLAMKSAKDDDRVTTTGLYIQTLNDLIDAFGTRDEALNRHIPEVINFLLIIAVILSGGSIGYTSALSNHRPSIAAIGFMIVAVILTSMLMDLDRPKRGAIQVSQKNMLDLQKEIRSSH
jgi:hypothetical protein